MLNSSAYIPLLDFLLIFIEFLCCFFLYSFAGKSVILFQPMQNKMKMKFDVVSSDTIHDLALNFGVLEPSVEL